MKHPSYVIYFSVEFGLQIVICFVLHFALVNPISVSLHMGPLNISDYLSAVVCVSACLRVTGGCKKKILSIYELSCLLTLNML